MLFRQIQCFHAVANTGSFSEAGTQCHLSQTAVSQQIRSLEAMLGTPLLKRNSRGFTLTPAGKLFYRKSSVLLSELENLFQEVKELSQGSRRTLRIGYVSCYAGGEFQDAVAQFAREHPDMELEILNGSREELFEAILVGQVDLVLSDLRRVFLDDFLHSELVQARCCVELSARHPLAAGEQVEPCQLREGRCILVAGESHRKAEMSYYREAMGFQGDFLVARTPQEARLMVAAGRGFLSVEDIGEEESPVEGVVRLPLFEQGAPVMRTYCAFWRNSPSSDQLQEFASLLRSQFNRQQQLKLG